MYLWREGGREGVDREKRVKRGLVREGRRDGRKGAREGGREDVHEIVGFDKIYCSSLDEVGCGGNNVLSGHVDEHAVEVCQVPGTGTGAEGEGGGGRVRENEVLREAYGG